MPEVPIFLCAYVAKRPPYAPFTFALPAVPMQTAKEKAISKKRARVAQEAAVVRAVEKQEARDLLQEIFNGPACVHCGKTMTLLGPEVPVLYCASGKAYYCTSTKEEKNDGTGK